MGEAGEEEVEKSIDYGVIGVCLIGAGPGTDNNRSDSDMMFY